MSDSELEDLISTWKEDEMTSVQQCMQPGRLSHRNRVESLLGVGLSAGLGLFGAGFLVHSAATAEVGRMGVAAMVIVVSGVMFRGMSKLRRRSIEARSLLAGTPLQVAEGQRMEVHSQVCGIQGRLANVMMALTFVLMVSMALSGMVAPSAAFLLLAATAAMVAYERTVRLPRLIAERARLDSLIAELRE